MLVYECVCVCVGVRGFPAISDTSGSAWLLQVNHVSWEGCLTGCVGVCVCVCVCGVCVCVCVCMRV